MGQSLNDPVRRHRLNEPEVKPVKDGLAEMLRIQVHGHNFEEELPTDVLMLFRVWYRLHTHSVGCPKYPEPETWGTVSSLLATSEMVPLLQVVA